MFVFNSKVLCNTKKMKTTTAHSCSHFTASIPPQSVNPATPAMDILSKSYKPTCDHCSHNRNFK